MLNMLNPLRITRKLLLFGAISVIT